RPRPLEADEAEVAELAAVERGLEETRPPGEARPVEQLVPDAGQLEKELPLPGVPVEGEEAVVPLEAGRALGHAWGRLPGRRPGRALRSRAGAWPASSG